MPGVVPGIPGWIVFAGVKFGGYCLAGLALKKVQPAVTAGIARIAATRTGLGILIGPPLTYGLAFGLARLFPETNLHSSILVWLTYGFVYVLRVFVWMLVIYLFTKQNELLKSRLWNYSAIGAVWSCILDVPGIALAIITPGQIPFC
jgi:hypothetical protein